VGANETEGLGVEPLTVGRGVGVGVAWGPSVELTVVGAGTTVEGLGLGAVVLPGGPAVEGAGEGGVGVVTFVGGAVVGVVGAVVAFVIAVAV